MKKSYVESLKEYDEPFELDEEKILAAMKRFKNAPMKFTSVALNGQTIRELKKLDPPEKLAEQNSDDV
jgi:hypothetical protein